MKENRRSLSYDDDIFWFFMEHPDVKMDGEKWNRRYIKYCFGNDSIPLYHDFHVSCSGTSLSTYNSMKSYLEIMTEILYEQCPKFHDCCRKPGDQALHNIILHKDRLLEKDKNIKIIKIPNDSGWILQITTMINHPIWSKKVPELSEKSMVVHQWKWARSIKAQFQKEYDYQAFCKQQEWNDCTISKDT